MFYMVATFGFPIFSEFTDTVYTKFNFTSSGAELSLWWLGGSSM